MAALFNALRTAASVGQIREAEPLAEQERLGQLAGPGRTVRIQLAQQVEHHAVGVLGGQRAQPAPHHPALHRGQRPVALGDRQLGRPDQRISHR